MTEHETFQGLTEALERCEAAAKAISELRPDQRNAWLQMAQTYAIAREAVWRLAGTGAVQ